MGTKVKVIDMFIKKQNFLPPEEWVMFKDETGEIVPAIVSVELWDTANAILKRCSEDVKSRQSNKNNRWGYSGKIQLSDVDLLRKDSRKVTYTRQRPAQSVALITEQLDSPAFQQLIQDQSIGPLSFFFSKITRILSTQRNVANHGSPSLQSSLSR